MDRAESERRHLRVGAAERRQSNGEIQYIDVLIRPLIDGQGRKVGMALTFFDTTARAS
jgi:hypothetical protein